MDTNGSEQFATLISSFSFVILLTAFHLCWVVGKSRKKNKTHRCQSRNKEKGTFPSVVLSFWCLYINPIQNLGRKTDNWSSDKMILGKKKARGNREVGYTAASEGSKCAISNSSVYRIKAPLKSASAYHRRYRLSCLIFSGKLSLVCRENTRWA